jgi:cytochrome c553
MKKAIVLLGAIMALAINSAQAAGDAAAGQIKSAVCAGCHGVDGNSMAANFPKIAGQHQAYLVKQLTEFKSGARKDTTGMMTGMVAPLSEQDMHDLSAYFSTQAVTGGSADQALFSLGEQLYRGGSSNGVSACLGCHGPSGNGNPAANFPTLSGQHADYITKQLQDFRSGARGNDPQNMMRNIATRMSDNEIKAVASYINGLH